MAFQTLQKPKPRVLTKREDRIAAEANWKRVCKAVTKRDQVCRCCGKHGNHHHHLVYRSHGGADVESNVVLTCGGPEGCHAKIHARVILVTFDPKHPAKTATFTRNTQWDRD